MKLIVRLHIVLSILMILIGCITLKLPSDLYYQLWFEYFLILVVLLVLVIFPSIYVYSEFKKKIVAVFVSLVYSFLVFVVILLPLYIFIGGFHFLLDTDIHIVNKDDKYLYTDETEWLESCGHKGTYEVVNFLFYKKVNTYEDC